MPSLECCLTVGGQIRPESCRQFLSLTRPISSDHEHTYLMQTATGTPDYSDRSACGLRQRTRYQSTGSFLFIINRFRATSAQMENCSPTHCHKRVTPRKQFGGHCQEVTAGASYCQKSGVSDDEWLLLAPGCRGCSLTEGGEQLAAIGIARPGFRMPLHCDGEAISFNPLDNAIRGSC
jgi:hypothetical protein